MAIKVKGDELELHGFSNKEETVTIDNYSDEFILFENQDRLLNIDLRNINLDSKTQEISLLNTSGIIRIVIPKGVQVISQIEHELGSIVNDTEKSNNKILLRGYNTLGDILVRYDL